MLAVRALRRPTLSSPLTRLVFVDETTTPQVDVRHTLTGYRLLSAGPCRSSTAARLAARPDWSDEAPKESRRQTFADFAVRAKPVFFKGCKFVLMAGFCLGVYRLMDVSAEEVIAQPQTVLIAQARKLSHDFQLALDDADALEARVDALRQRQAAASSDSGADATPADEQDRDRLLAVELAEAEQQLAAQTETINRMGSERHQAFYRIYLMLSDDETGALVPQFIDAGLPLVLNELGLTNNGWLQSCLLGIVLPCVERPDNRAVTVQRGVDVVTPLLDTLAGWQGREPPKEEKRGNPPQACARLLHHLLNELASDAAPVVLFERQRGLHTVLEHLGARLGKYGSNTDALIADCQWLVKLVGTVAALACERPSLVAGLLDHQPAVLLAGLAACLDMDVAAYSVESKKTQRLLAQRIAQLARALSTLVPPTPDNAGVFRHAVQLLVDNGMSACAVAVLRRLLDEPSVASLHDRWLLAGLLAADATPAADAEALAILSTLRETLEERFAMRRETSLHGVPLPDVLISLGQLHRRRGQPDDACEAFRKATRVDPTCLQCYLHLATLLLEPRSDDASAVVAAESALQALQSAQRLAPDNYTCLVLEGKALAIAGSFDEAVAAYRRAVARHPHKREAYAQLAALFVAAQRLDDAAQTCLDAVDADPSNWRALMLLADVEQRQGRDPVKTFVRIVDAWKQRPEIFAEEPATEQALQQIVDYQQSTTAADSASSLAYHLRVLHEKRQLLLPTQR